MVHSYVSPRKVVERSVDSPTQIVFLDASITGGSKSSSISR